jgi:hypothetical protein
MGALAAVPFERGEAVQDRQLVVYGVPVAGGMTLEEIAQELGTTRQQVYVIQERAMRKLRRSPEARGLLEFVNYELADAPRAVSFFTKISGPRGALLRALVAERDGPLVKEWQGEAGKCRG